MMNLTGYQLNAELYNGSRTIVYRGKREVDSLPVAIKFLKNPYPNFSELVQFRNQYTLAKNLNFPRIIKTYSLETYQNGYALVMEDFGGVSLSHYFQSRQKLPAQLLPEFLSIALVLCEALDLLYRERVIHKDIKPSNILINPQTKEVKLIDFSIASLLPRETQTLLNPHVLEGTLAYISPEQTGRMNRGIDYRTDFYSLGVTFYELLTGELPFSSNDAMELVHSHLAKTAPLVNEINPNIPSVLARIVNKLMAKNAEDRYQSAFGLKFDLEKCLIKLRETGEIRDFEIASKDACDRFLIPEKLYGRESEVQILLKSFERVSQGASELMLVAGFSGIGKTAVVNEVHKPITQQKGYFIKGKFDQFNRNIPLSAFVQALRDLMGQLLSESDSQLAEWKAQILKAVGENGQVLIEVIPELEQVIGQQPAAPELSGTAAQNRFNLLFQKFIQVFTTIDHPLVIFLDDLQWSDSASLQLLKVLMESSGYLLVLGAYRDNEVSPVHPLMLTIGELKKANLTVNTITLSPLSLEHSNCLVADTLKCSQELSKPLTQLVDRKTQGNPFFTTQFLKALYEDGYITFDRDQGYWQCDIAQVNTLALTDDVVEFMALQLQKLPAATQGILKLAACIGAQFDLQTLAIVAEQSQTEAATFLWRALQEGLIIPITQVYKFFQSEEIEQFESQNHANPAYRFLHDRVQQAAYSLIAAEQKQATHLRIGQLLLNSTPQEELEATVFDIVNHLNIGIDLTNDQSWKYKLAQLNLMAGEKAKKSNAHATAIKHLSLGIELLSIGSWEANYELTFALYRECAECEYLNGNFQASQQLLDIAFQHTSINLDQAKLYSILMNLCMTQGDNFANGIGAGLEGLEVLGLSVPRQDDELQQLISNDQQQVQQFLASIDIASLYDHQVQTDLAQNFMMRLLVDLWALAYLDGNLNLLQLTVLKIVLLSLKNGNTSFSAFGYVTYAMNLAFGQDYSTAYQLAQLALRLNTKFNRTDLVGKVNNLFCHSINPYNRPFVTNLALYQESYQRCTECGDLTYAAWALFFGLWTRLETGENLQAVEDEANKYVYPLEEVGDFNMFSSFLAVQRLIRNLQGKNENRYSLTDEVFDENSCITKWRENNFEHGLNWYHYVKAQLLYTYEQYEAALQACQVVEDKVAANFGFFPVTKYYFYYLLILTAIYPSASEQDQKSYWQVINSHQKQIQIWANSCPENFLHQFLLASAEIARIQNQKLEAIELYEQAISAARAEQLTHHEALANELAAKFYLDWGKDKFAAGYMQEAYYCYARWGAKAKVDDLEERYPQLLQPILQAASQRLTVLETLSSITAPVYSIHSTAHTHSSGSINQTLDLAALLQISQTFASTIALNELLKKLTQTMLENSGADGCALILCENDQWQIRVMASAEQVTLKSVPLEDNSTVPVKLIHYVKNTAMTVVVDDLKTDLPVIGDYLSQYQPKSVLCLPIFNQGNLNAILYLENRSTSGVFTSDRIAVLNFLCTQAAISLENARLYQQLEYSLQNIQQKSQNLAEALALSDGQHKIMTLIVQRVSLDTILAEVARFIESHTHHPAYCSFLLLDTEERLRCAAAPNLPAAYNALIDGIKIGPEVGSCGTAAYCKASVTVTDIATDPLWAKYQVALDFGLQACASTPILGAEGQVLATLAMYQPVAGKFTLHDRKLMEVATYLARISIERYQADVELRNAQLQMVQSEKMASLGNLVAGVAHEINNPIGFLNGSINNGKDYVQDLLEHLALYQQHYPHPVPPIKDHAEDIDLEYVCEDLPELLNSMQGATNRIKSISTSLRTFSRADTEYKVRANLHEGIDSTLLILKYRLKANEHRPAIEAIANYGEIPAIYCFPGQLNQVFMNILANAIDMFDEMAQGRSFKELEANPQQITISTALSDGQVQILIGDNGKGIDPEVQSRIFDHLFTTKSVGKGTGLGLAIARQIVVEKHQGSIEVESTVGRGTQFCIRLPIST
ncbi:AAA family ATPase [Aerosakkonema sp. BLCC-F2]